VTAERRVVAVVSGGLDSTTMAYSLRAQGYSLIAISFDYGQRHRKELAFAEQMAADLDAPWTLIDLHAAGLTNVLTGSALTDDTVTVPDGHYADESMKITVVPNRNAIMLSIACALAVTRDAGAVAFGAHTGDHFIYPDCRPEFVRAFEAMVNVAVEGLASIEILAPFLSMTKTDIVKLGDELKVPFERTWSCYKGGALHCGTRGTCVERREAFAQADLADPTVYDGESAIAR
jgi:7-cyano-7-deazaguanine synthase